MAPKVSGRAEAGGWPVLEPWAELGRGCGWRQAPRPTAALALSAIRLGSRHCDSRLARDGYSARGEAG